MVNATLGKYGTGHLVINIVVLLFRVVMGYFVHCLIREFKAQERPLGFHASLENGIVYDNPAMQPDTPVVNVVTWDNSDQQAEQNQSQHQGQGTQQDYL